MKRYVWMAAVVMAATGANASKNPFELNSNVKQMQQEQVLLKDLRKEVKTLEKMKEAANNADIDTNKDKTKAPAAASHIAALTEKTETGVKAANGSVSEKQNKEEKSVEEKAQQEKTALAKLKMEREAAQKKAQEAELAKLKAQKARLLKEIKEQVSKNKTSRADAGNKKIASVSDINITEEETEAAKKAEEELKEAIKEVDGDN